VSCLLTWLSEPVTMTSVVVLVLPAVTRTATPVCPPGTLTGETTGRMLAWLLAMLTNMPPLGAFELRRTVRLPLLPSISDGGSETELSIGGLTMMIVVFVMEPSLAMMVTDAC